MFTKFHDINIVIWPPTKWRTIYCVCLSVTVRR